MVQMRLRVACTGIAHPDPGKSLVAENMTGKID
jgi:hypothetical protein